MKRAGHGFSLLELSVVIGIISLIAGAGITIATGALKAADRVMTQERLATIKLALDSYAKTYGYLPCPAARALVPSAADFGKESRAGTDCAVVAGIVGVPTIGSDAYIGGIPVRTLGLPDTYAADAWGGKLTYAVTRGHVRDGASYANSDGILEVWYGDFSSVDKYPVTSIRRSVEYTAVNASCHFTTNAAPNSINNRRVHVRSNGTPQIHKGSYIATWDSAIRVDLAGLTCVPPDDGFLTWQEPGPGASYVVVSHGPDGRGAYPLKSIGIPTIKKCLNDGINATPPPCSTAANNGQCIDIQNCDDSDVFFYDTAYNDAANPDQYFDDYVVWGSNAGVRVAVNPTLYSGCNPGSCETWCAVCDANYNYPGAFTLNALDGNVVDAVLCKKFIFSDSVNCKASCFWSGTTAAGYQRCP